MIQQSEVIAFFDRLSGTWDDDIIKDAAKINRIFDTAQIKENMHVLDVACGTGVLIPDYMERKVAKVTAFDISPGMISVAREKFRGMEKVTFLCTDVEHLQLDEPVDCVMIYNAFPHFANPKQMLESLSGLLKKGGTLMVAHDMGIEQLNAHHEGKAKHVSNGMISIEEMKVLFDPYFEVMDAVSEADIYYVCGVKR